MLGSALSYAATRLAGRAVDTVERKIFWGGLSGILMLAALVFSLTAIFVFLQAQFGVLQTAIALGAGCAVLSILLFWMPSFLTSVERYAEEEESPSEELAGAVDAEAREAVDTFGALQVATSAFMIGLSAARGLKRQNNS